MNRFKTIILIFILTFSLFSCKDNKEKRKEIVAEKITQFSSERIEWNDLSQRVLKDPFVNANAGKFINPLDLNESIAKELEEKGIYRLTVINNSKCQEVEYTTNWTEYPIGTLYLTWTTCDSKQTEKGYYKDNFDLNFIEVWGIGNNWMIWTDSDFI
ncbi:MULTISPECIES: hypothetical protein [Flavobacteriaceae]|uniref:hypothetical protein n=1 Tax=Flavobacteriaceae TaxID=49546 RepID=UPI00261E3232|nr:MULTISPECIES: hypothetical protein [Flavobacteriaceae]